MGFNSNVFKLGGLIPCFKLKLVFLKMKGYLKYMTTVSDLINYFNTTNRTSSLGLSLAGMETPIMRVQ